MTKLKAFLLQSLATGLAVSIPITMASKALARDGLTVADGTTAKDASSVPGRTVAGDGRAAGDGAAAKDGPTSDKQNKLQAGREQARLPIGSRLHQYDEIVSPDMESASSLANRARVALTNGNYTRAINLAKRALNKDDDDIDIHSTYAAAIEAKLEGQAERDPQLYKTCVHEWLLVYRNEVGEEKGMTIKGINVVGTFWNDDFRGTVAKKHLKKLTGYLPKPWETDNRYMARTLKPAETTVTGKVKSTAP